MLNGARRSDGDKTGPASSSILHPLPGDVEIIGPAPLPFYKLRGHFRWHVMLKLPRPVPGAGPVLLMPGKIQSILLSLKKNSAVAFALDIDPLNIL